jgi:hypothetical protein
VTIRDVISRQMRKAAMIAYGGAALFGLGGLAITVNERLIVLALPGFGIFMGGVLFMLLGVRCPRCGGRIGPSVHASGSPFRVPPKIRFCPFCGVAWDSPMDETQQV